MKKKSWLLPVLLTVLLLSTLVSCGSQKKKVYGDGICDVCGRRTAVYDDGSREMCNDCLNSFFDWLDKQ